MLAVPLKYIVWSQWGGGQDCLHSWYLCGSPACRWDWWSVHDTCVCVCVCGTPYAKDRWSRHQRNQWFTKRAVALLYVRRTPREHLPKHPYYRYTHTLTKYAKNNPIFSFQLPFFVRLPLFIFATPWFFMFVLLVGDIRTEICSRIACW